MHIMARTAVVTAVVGGALSLTAATRDATIAQGADKALLAKGDSIFHGQLANGLCWTCHGPTAKGIPGLGPDLTDKTWIHGDGSLEFITNTVRTGVPKPKKSTTPMLPGGGIPLTDAQMSAVAAYVFSLSASARK